MRHPRTLVTFSDSGAHVSQIMDSSLQTHLLAYWVREREAFTLEEAVRNLTFAPATAWELRRPRPRARGLRRRPQRDRPATVARRCRAWPDLPGGAKRLVQRSVGIRATVVGGEPVLLDGEHTGALPGVLLRR